MMILCKPQNMTWLQFGTKSLKIVGNTSKGPGKGYTIDKKNEIDDSKTK